MVNVVLRFGLPSFMFSWKSDSSLTFILASVSLTACGRLTAGPADVSGLQEDEPRCHRLPGRLDMTEETSSGFKWNFVWH